MRGMGTGGGEQNFLVGTSFNRLLVGPSVACGCLCHEPLLVLGKARF
jgi:hypothetical protein